MLSYKIIYPLFVKLTYAFFNIIGNYVRVALSYSYKAQLDVVPGLAELDILTLNNFADDHSDPWVRCGAAQFTVEIDPVCT